MRRFVAHWLGRVPYLQAHALQEQILRARIAGAVGDTVLLLEHDPVITLGRTARAHNILVSRTELTSRGIQVHETGRGGDVTYHGPGQLVAYPIFDLRPDRCDVRRYVRDLAHVMIGISHDMGIEASFLEGDSKLVGVWVDADRPRRWAGDPRLPGGAKVAAKIGAIGVRISRWVTMHGFAYNVSTDLTAYRWIVPCGIAEYGVTSVVASGIRPPAMESIARSTLPHFERVFDAHGEWAALHDSRSMWSLVST
jgi:lipoyl(octanoyl) transferase